MIFLVFASLLSMTIFDCIKDPFYQHKYVLERILMELLGLRREELIIHYDDVLSESLMERTKNMYNEYAIGKQPLEYILGYVEYGWLRFHVNRHTIIPRPETEYMIEEVRKYISAQIPDYRYLLVDVGTGSGVLWLSILHSHGSQIDFAFLIDISEDALGVTKKNYDFLIEHGHIDRDISVVIEKGNLFSSHALDEKNFSGFLTKGEIIVVANLPYIPDETFDTNPDQSIKFEPRVAFVGWDDGLDLYRIMFEQIQSRTNPPQPSFDREGVSFPIVMFLEMMTWQVDILRKEFEWLEFEEIATFHFQIRIVRVIIKK